MWAANVVSLSYYIKNLTELSGLHAKSYMWPKPQKNAFPLVKHSDGGIMTGGSFSSVWTGKQFGVDGKMAGAKKKVKCKTKHAQIDSEGLN